MTWARRVKSVAHQIAQKRWAFRLIGIAVCALILAKIDLGATMAILGSTDTSFLLISFALQAVALVVTTVRWQLLMHALEIRVPFSQSLIHQLVGTAAALVTPGQFGEFVKVLYHRNYGYPVPESFLSIVIDRLYDLLILLLFGFVSAILLFGGTPAWFIVLLGAGGLGLAGWLYIRNSESGAHWVSTTLTRMSPQAYKESVEQSAQRLVARIGGLSPATLLACAGLSIASYVLLVLRIYALALAVHIDAPFWYFVQIVPLLRLAGLVPISVSGIGTRDITIIYFLARVGVPEEASLIVSMLALFTLVLQMLVGLVAWWRYPLHARAGSKAASQGPLDEEEWTKEVRIRQ